MTATDSGAVGDLARLRVAPLLRGLDDRQLAEVRDAGELLDTVPGQTLVEEGGTDRDLYVLLTGQADVLVRGDDGELIAVGTLKAGDAFGELGALLAEVRAATILCTEPGQVLKLSDAALLACLERIGPLGLALARELARDLEIALEERNTFQEQATPDRVEVEPADLARSSTGLARFYVASVRNLMRRNRLLTSDHYPAYTTQLRVSAEDERRWHELFGVPEGMRLPLTLHAVAWTPLLTRLVEDLGISARNLTHVRTRVTYHPERPLPQLDGTATVQVQLGSTVPLGDQRVALLVATRVLDDGDVRFSGDDVFVVTDVDRATLARLRREGHGAPPDLPAPGRLPTLDPDDPDVRSVGLALAGDLGLRYGRLSGNLNPVHTTGTVARLMGHSGPTLQHLAVVNLVLRHLADARGATPGRLQLDFLAPVLVSQTVELRFDDHAIEVTDAEDRLLVVGHVEGAALPVQAAPEPPPTATRDLVAAEDGLDEGALQRVLERTHHDLRERVRRLLAQDRFRPPDTLAGPEFREQVMDWVRMLAADGLGAVAYPTEVGGADDPAGAIAVFETLATHDLSLVVKFGVQFGLFGGAILHLGTSRAPRSASCPPSRRLELPGCFAMTETGHGSNVADLETHGRVYDPATADFVIHTPRRRGAQGLHRRRGPHARAGRGLRPARGRRRSATACTPSSSRSATRAATPLPGVRIEDCGAKMGLNGVDNGRFWFDGVRVPRDALLDRFADGRRRRRVLRARSRAPASASSRCSAPWSRGRVSVGAGAAWRPRSRRWRSPSATRERRRQFGPPGAPRRCSSTTRRTSAGCCPPLADHLRPALRAARPRRALCATRTDADEPAARARGVEAWPPAQGRRHAGTRPHTIQACREACGGQGYLAENRFAALKADSDVFTTFEGDNTVLLQLVAKGLLSDYKNQFGTSTWAAWCATCWAAWPPP